MGDEGEYERWGREWKERRQEEGGERGIQEGITETKFLKVILENTVLEATVCMCLCECVCMLCVFLE